MFQTEMHFLSVNTIYLENTILFQNNSKVCPHLQSKETKLCPWKLLYTDYSDTFLTQSSIDTAMKCFISIYILISPLAVQPNSD